MTKKQVKNAKYRELHKDELKAKAKAWREANKDKIAAKNKEYRESKGIQPRVKKEVVKSLKVIKTIKLPAVKHLKNLKPDVIEDKPIKVVKPIKSKEEITARKKAYYEANKIKLSIKQQEWREANKEKLRNYHKEKYTTDILYKLKTNVKNLIGNSIRLANFTKLSRTEQILGCSYADFKAYLESKFEPWMNWQNRGLYNGTEGYGWDIDHKLPLSSATCEADVLKLNHYTNLQPLCSYKNRYIKRNNI